MEVKRKRLLRFLLSLSTNYSLPLTPREVADELTFQIAKLLTKECDYKKGERLAVEIYLETPI
ncbi:hypothetical protein ES703_08209 [subsurface metagenome]